MIEIADLPAINATLNSLSAGLLATGDVLIRRGRVTPHKACMLAAFGTSTLFLTSYLIYHAHVGSQPFLGEGFTRIVYFTVLGPPSCPGISCPPASSRPGRWPTWR